MVDAGKFHGGFELAVGGAELVFVGASVGPEAVGGRCIDDGLGNSKVARHFVDLGFVEVRDGAQVHASVTVFGEESDAEIFDFVAGSGHEQAVVLSLGVEGGHAQSGAGVGKGKVALGGIGQVQCRHMGVEDGREVHAAGGDRRVAFCKKAHPVLGARHLVGGLVDGHFEKVDVEARGRTKAGGDGGIDSARDPHDKSACPRLLGVGTKPIDNVLRYGGCVHRTTFGLCLEGRQI